MSKFRGPHRRFCRGRFASMLTVVHKNRPVFRVQKSALIAAAAGCLALSFATPNQVATADDTSSGSDLGYCPRPGSEVIADGVQDMLSDQPAVAESTEQVLPVDSVPVLKGTQDNSLRVATYNAALSRDSAGELFEELSAPGTEDATEVARIIQTVRPDVLVLTGIDTDAGAKLAQAFNTNYLAVGSDDRTGVTYPYFYTDQSNAGVESGADLDRDGTIGGPGDALGYGDFPGQSSMIVYSKYPIDTAQIRDFSSLPWSSVPDNSIPADFTELERDILPLSSVAHWDVPIEIDGEILHVLASATEDVSVTPHAQARNSDQIRFWQDYLESDTNYILDHRGNRGPLEDNAAFVIAGSLKADPQGHGPAEPAAISELLQSETIVDPQQERTLPPTALGRGVLPNNPDAEYHTAPVPDTEGQTYRADYVLPGADLSVTDAGVLETGTAHNDVYRGYFGIQSSDNSHHMVWADIAVVK